MDTTTTDLLTGYEAVEACREADRRYLAGDINGRNAVLATVDPSMRNGREILPTVATCGYSAGDEVVAARRLRVRPTSTVVEAGTTGTVVDVTANEWHEPVVHVRWKGTRRTVDYSGVSLAFLAR